jgi:hypothetical protein
MHRVAGAVVALALALEPGAVAGVAVAQKARWRRA